MSELKSINETNLIVDSDYISDIAKHIILNPFTVPEVNADANEILSLIKKTKQKIYISEMGEHTAHLNFKEPTDIPNIEDIFSMIRDTKAKSLDAIPKPDINAFDGAKVLSSVVDNYVQTKINEQDSSTIEEDNDFEVFVIDSSKTKKLKELVECVPIGASYITYEEIPSKKVKNIQALITQHKSRVLKEINSREPIDFKPKKRYIKLRVTKTLVNGIETTVIKAVDKDKKLFYATIILVSALSIVSTVFIIKKIDRIQNVRIATKQIEQIVHVTDEVLLNNWLDSFNNMELDLGTVHPEYFVSDIKYFNKVIEELVKHTKNINIEKTKDGYLVTADVIPVSQYASIINAPIVKPDLKELKDDFKKGKYTEDEVREKLGDIQYDIFTDFCFIEVPVEKTIPVSSMLTIEDGKVLGTIDFLDTLLDATGIRNNVRVFDTEIGDYMYSLTTNINVTKED